ncbi:helix-turn-helix transcriptional regulator [Cohnella panacarvi]|uniref:helix-turn-helix transcriptional regulator n=1 Tax=Cohnella panacarvi TaxID=400776 RepID=UPI00047C1302|nr:AraC family transcriptional regulator [Cohnella panacarvi]
MRIHCSFPTMELSPYLILPESVGRYAEMPDHEAVRASGTLPYFNLHVVASGEGYVEEDGERRLLQAGDAFFYFPNRPQRYYSCTDEPWDVYWIHFYGQLLPELLTGQGLRSSIVWSIHRPERLLDNFEALIGEAQGSKLLRPSVLSTLTYGVLAEFMAEAVPYRTRKSPAPVIGIADLLPALQDAACEPFSLERWASELDVSVHYFCKLFRRTMQMSPMDFVTLCRIRRAKQLLLDDRDQPVQRVAEACGYPSASYFIKRFKEKEGVTPAAYRLLHGR